MEPDQLCAVAAWELAGAVGEPLVGLLLLPLVVPEGWRPSALVVEVVVCLPVHLH